MSDLQMEAELRDALRRRASGVPVGAGERLRLVDYRPRSSRVPWTVGAVSGGVATAGAVVSVVVLGGAQPAFAGWSPTPVTQGVPTADATQGCQAQLASLASLPGTAAEGGVWTSVLTDVRGPYALAVYGDGSALATCFSGPTFTVVTRRDAGAGGPGGGVVTGASASGRTTMGRAMSSELSVTASRPNAGAATGDVTGLSESHLVQAGDGAYTMVEGQVASDVTDVTLVRGDGTDVEATTGNGWFVAWWPGSLDAASAIITTPAGTTTQKLQPPPVPSLPPPPAPGSGSPPGNS